MVPLWITLKNNTSSVSNAKLERKYLIVDEYVSLTMLKINALEAFGLLDD